MVGYCGVIDVFDIWMIHNLLVIMLEEEENKLPRQSFHKKNRLDVFENSKHPDPNIPLKEHFVHCIFVH